MRRNAENLIVLSGSVPGRGWRQPVPLVDVVRGAVAEIEDYERVTVLPMGSAALGGRVVGDVIHLLAELVENATSFSPPETPVQVGGQKVANGFVVEIEDRGLGMSEADLALANEQLRNPPEFKLSSTARLGLYVVGRLAERHGIRVQLRESAYGGTMAIVLIPSTLVVGGDEAETLAARLESAEPVTLEAVPNGDDTGSSPAPLASAVAPSLRSSTSVLARPESRSRTGELPQRTPIEPAAREPEPLTVVEPAADSDPTGSGGQTPNGLPRRVRQANLAVALQQEPDAASPTPEEEGHKRAPEDIRRMLSSYQRQTRRGRSDAERPLTAHPDATPDRPVSHLSPVDSAARRQLPATATPGDNPGDLQEEDH
jgi:hypothetical protein